MEALLDAAQAVLEVEASLGEVVARFRYWAYALLFAIVFCETGLVVALGDVVNYAIGRRLGRRVLLSGRVPFVKRRHVEQTEGFFRRHGGQALVIARFVPMGRTLAPFLAGAAHMPLPRFWLYNITGAVLWTLTFTLGGYFFGTLPWVRDNLALSMVLIVGVSLAPAAISLGLARRSRSATGVEPLPAGDSDEPA